jgi:hypothetical protein
MSKPSRATSPSRRRLIHRENRDAATSPRLLHALVTPRILQESLRAIAKVDAEIMDERLVLICQWDSKTCCNHGN